MAFSFSSSLPGIDSIEPARALMFCSIGVNAPESDALTEGASPSTALFTPAMTEARDCSSFDVVSERFFSTDATTPDKLFSTDSNRRVRSSLLFSFSPTDSPCILSVRASRRTMNASRRPKKIPREAFSTRAANKPQRLVPKMPFMLPNRTWIVSRVPCVVELSIATPAVATEYIRPKNVPIRPRRITVPPELRGIATVEPFERTSKAIGESSLRPFESISRA